MYILYRLYRICGLGRVSSLVGVLIMANFGVSIVVMFVAIACVLLMLINRRDPTSIGWVTVIALLAAFVQIINLNGAF